MTAVTEPISLGALRRETIAEFCSVIGDPNPLHLDVPLAQSLGFRDVVVPGSLLATLVLIEAEAAFGPGFDAVIKFKRWVSAGEPLLVEISSSTLLLKNSNADVCVVARLS